MKYVALIHFEDRATGMHIDAGAPYPPGERVVREEWIQYLASSKNATGKPVIQKVKKPSPVQPKPIKSEPKVKQEEAQPMIPVIESEPKPEPIPVIEEKPEPVKAEPVIANPFVITPKPKPDPFDGLTEQGIYDIFKILSHKVRFIALPETKEDYLDFLKHDPWRGENMAVKRKLLNLLGVSGATKFTEKAVDSTLEDVLIRAINAKLKE